MPRRRALPSSLLGAIALFLPPRVVHAQAPCTHGFTGTIERASLTETGAQTFTCPTRMTVCKNNSHPTISGDGRYVAWDTDAMAVVGSAPNPSFTTLVYLRDRFAGTTELISRESDGRSDPPEPANGNSSFVRISTDGTVAVYHSNATNLDPLDTNGLNDVYRFDRATGLTTLVSHTAAYTAGNDLSASADVSLDGRFVAFRSRATDLGPLAPGSCTTLPTAWDNIYVRDTLTGYLEWISHGPGCAPPDADCLTPRIDDAGRVIAFASKASNLVPGASNVWVDVFSYDRVTGVLTPVSVALGGQLTGNGPSQRPDVSTGNGRYVAFESVADNLVLNDTNMEKDIFVRDLVAGTTVRVSVDSSGAQLDEGSTYPAISSDGRYVVFSSLATNVVPGPTGGKLQYYRHDRDSDRDGIFDQPGGICTVRISINANGREGDCLSGGNTDISDDGSTMPFMSHATNLVPGDTNGFPGAPCLPDWTQGRDVFVRWIP